MATILITHRNTSRTVAAINSMLRISLGVIIFIKGVCFLKDDTSFYGYIAEADMDFLQFMLMHMVVMAHLAGGLMIIFGVLTRFAVLLQIPVLLGAVFFVGKYAGMHDEFILAVSTLLVSMYVLMVGSGKFSFDHYIEQHADGETHHAYHGGDELI